MDQSKIYHGGGLHRGGGFSTSGGSSLDTIRVLLEEKSFHYGNSNPITSALHTTPKDTNFGYKTDDFTPLTRGFVSFPRPHKRWTRVISGTTLINFELHGYHETVIAAPNNIVRFKISLTITRVNETINYTAPSTGTPPTYLCDLDCGTIPAYQLATIRILNMNLHNPSGLNPNDECMFHLRVLRENSSGGDTYPNVFRIMGGYVEFPLA